MGFINSEGKFNDNTFLIDGLIFNLKGQLSLYIIENNGIRLMIDAGVELSARKIVKKIKEFDLFPVHKILLTHSHFDHVQGVNKLKKIMKDYNIEILASEKAIDNLKNPERMNAYFNYKVDPIEGVQPVKEGDIIDLNGLQLKVLEFPGHTQDSIALLDIKNKNIFVGDAIIDKVDYDTIMPEFVPPDFNESDYLKTIRRLKSMKDKLNSISLAHFGVWTDNNFIELINQVEDFHNEAKKYIIKWYNENPSAEYVAEKYHDKFIPNSKIHTKENIHGLVLEIQWFIDGLKNSGDLA